MFEFTSFKAAVVAEFIGMFFFQLIGGSSDYAPFNGVVLMVVIFFTANISGGVVNPAVALALFLAREISFFRWVMYVLAELSGAVLGSVLAGWIDKNCFALSAENGEPLGCLSNWGNSNSGPGCVAAIVEDEYYRVFIWEAVGTFVLVSTVLHTAVAKPGFGCVTPIAIGLSIAINVDASGSLTGGAYNPARYFGPALAFGCRLEQIWLYWLAEFFGASLAALWYHHYTKALEVRHSRVRRGSQEHLFTDIRAEGNNEIILKEGGISELNAL